jgi:hypothetical protein
LVFLKILGLFCDWKDMSAKYPPSRSCSLAQRRHDMVALPVGFWTGTREGLIATGLAVVGALLFGGAAGAWFSPDGAPGWSVVAARMAPGSAVMAFLIALSGTLLAGRNPIFWGVGMPLLVYGAGSFCAFVSGYAGAPIFFFGAPVFCGLAIASGVLTAFALDRDR